MVIQHNLLAQNANRNLGVTAKSQAKSTEKLSSGYKINRAADNVAGLAVSEKMRGQIRGLNRASENAEDGISLVQTAEGAMQESQSILHRMRELSVQAANDTNTEDDRKQIDVELNELNQELDRIANTTEFNGMKLINGDFSLEAKDAQTRVQEYLKGSWLGDAMSRIKDAIGLTLNGDTTIKVEFASGMGNALASVTSSYGSSDFLLKISSDAISGMTASDFSTGSGPIVGGILTDRVITHELTHAVTFQNFAGASDVANWFIEGIAEAVQGHDRTEPETVAQMQTNVATRDPYQMGYYAVSYMRYNVKNGTFEEFLENMKTDTFENSMQKFYGMSGTDMSNKVANLAATDGEGFLSACHITLADGRDDALTDWDMPEEDIVPNGGGPMTVEDKIETIALGNSSCKITWADLDYKRNELRLQIGANSGQELAFSIGNMRSKELIGTEDIDVSSYEKATASITRFDGAIQKVSTYRAKLGAIQNRLEHTISNLDNSEENLQSSESKIRDTDMAEEMTRYSKNSILMQAGQSMLAQANQATQGVMSLLQ